MEKCDAVVKLPLSGWTPQDKGLLIEVVSSVLEKNGWGVDSIVSEIWFGNLEAVSLVMRTLTTDEINILRGMRR